MKFLSSLIYPARKLIKYVRLSHIVHTSALTNSEVQNPPSLADAELIYEIQIQFEKMKTSTVLQEVFEQQ